MKQSEIKKSELTAWDMSIINSSASRLWVSLSGVSEDECKALIINKLLNSQEFLNSLRTLSDWISFIYEEEKNKQKS